MTDFEGLLRALDAHAVRFILVGGVAATVHGATRLTQDLDLVYAREPDDLERLCSALAPYEPYPRGAPPGLPFRWDAQTLRQGLNFTLTTTLGDVDLLGEVIGGGTYEALLPHSQGIELFDRPVRCVTLPALIRLKRAAGRPRDFEAIAELEALLDEQADPEGSRTEGPDTGSSGA
jgi:hypothetical protein